MAIKSSRVYTKSIGDHTCVGVIWTPSYRLFKILGNLLQCVVALCQQCSSWCSNYFRKHVGLRWPQQWNALSQQSIHSSHIFALGRFYVQYLSSSNTRQVAVSTHLTYVSCVWPSHARNHTSSLIWLFLSYPPRAWDGAFAGFLARVQLSARFLFVFVHMVFGFLPELEAWQTN